MHVGIYLDNLSVLYVLQGKYDKAEPLIRRALVIMEKNLGAEHPNVAICLENYAGLLKEMGRGKRSRTPGGPGQGDSGQAGGEIIPRSKIDSLVSP